MGVIELIDNILSLMGNSPRLPHLPPYLVAFAAEMRDGISAVRVIETVRAKQAEKGLPNDASNELNILIELIVNALIDELTLHSRVEIGITPKTLEEITNQGVGGAYGINV